MFLAIQIPLEALDLGDATLLTAVISGIFASFKSLTAKIDHQYSHFTKEIASLRLQLAQAQKEFELSLKEVNHEMSLNKISLEMKDREINTKIDAIKKSQEIQFNALSREVDSIEKRLDSYQSDRNRLSN